jgi:predicted RNA-binding Zn ribbon-like protein
MLGRVSRSRRSAKGIKPRRDYRAREPAAPPRPAERIARLSAANVLEGISQARLQRDELDAELALLIDHAVSLGIGWPDIARCLGVSRQAARQYYQRRHRDGASRQDHLA